MTAAQFILDNDGNAIFAVLPIEDYRSLTGSMVNVGEGESAKEKPLLASLVNTDDWTLKLPFGGSFATIMIADLILVMEKHQMKDLAINQRAQSYDKFPEDQLLTLDPILRRLLPAAAAGYRNTMQATTDVVDSLIDCGLFIRTRKKYPYSSRVVNALEIVAEKKDEILQTINN